ncbi:MAG: chemotaxis protein CheW [Haloplanus sp.]
MTDDRAERINRMREGRRDDETDSADGDDEDGASADTAADPTDTDSDDGSDADSDDGSDADSDDGSDGQSAALDDEVAAALDEMDSSDVSEANLDFDDDAVPSINDEDGEENGETAEEGTTDDETVSVLEFILGDERYCLDISFIEQIVERGTVTRIPNAPAFVEGVIDLRGDITTVIDPTETLAADTDGDGDLIIVFDSSEMDDEWSVGWAVDGVRRVSTVSLAEIKESPVDEPWINGVVKRDDDGEFVIWTEPGELMRVDGDER